MSAADIVASAREFADGLDVSLTEAGDARIHIARLADTIEQLITDLDARFEHSEDGLRPVTRNPYRKEQENTNA